ncbi:biotin--[acetyl-CoA-carboxylase] ligase [Microbacterium sediminis]|uniref:biotin--[biotin carboxyl-carrier protein] ligase n=1 Tax=Microbacterium sediminis TaxID=904291 RepID=A0A1B9N817_9MICO|nr:biotin--[acetyl-CoA-carboxylase] ligase [Microbacterium sediminis]OCG72728.1 biotin--[acetyl-CoA-carboxylase] ligase [Microbacterium sediminis]QBR74758.1 biotin--[acetyl-CoA-carboxylase] ligase [Microbacterium sediminis]
MAWDRTTAAGARVTEVTATGSTNADLVAAVAAGRVAHLDVLLTRDQRSGRGRLDRTWQAPAGASLAVSVALWVDEVPPAARGWIPLLAGAAMARAVRAQLPGREVGAKWPNDVLVAGRKICGILAEGTADPGAVVVGAGVNTAMTAEQLPVPTATSFAVAGAACDDDRLLADYLGALDRTLGALARAGGDAIASGALDAVTGVCATIGQDVAVSLPDGRVLRGTATAIDEQGRLVVRAADGDHAVSAGDVVHVRPA